ncbi:MAG: LysR family transcriptional regulator [Candidatus Sulfopaludibacter sp.]|nr:LysR family transcriptional regulator [Candidatus Sulfopaludibacter sp.]
MEFHQLRYFCAVARTGSFTRAAVEEGVAQPSLSQQIVKLEQTMGSKLFDRLGRSVELTEYGRTLLPQALAILRQVNEARGTLESLRRGVGGHLSVGCIPTLTPYFLAPRISDFTRRFPDVDLRLMEETTPKLVELLQTAKLDLALVGLPVNSPEMLCSELFREPIWVVVGPGHRLAENDYVKVADLRGEKMVLLKEGHCFRDDALRICKRARLPFEPIFETDQFSSIFPLVASGLGITLAPQMAAHTAQECRLLPLERDTFRRVGYIRVRRHVAGAAQGAFVKWLRETVRAEDWSARTAGAGRAIEGQCAVS